MRIVTYCTLLSILISAPVHTKDSYYNLKRTNKFKDIIHGFISGCLQGLVDAELLKRFGRVPGSGRRIEFMRLPMIGFFVYKSFPQLQVSAFIDSLMDANVYEYNQQLAQQWSWLSYIATLYFALHHNTFSVFGQKFDLQI